jgi:short-subunit dehydrogenase
MALPPPNVTSHVLVTGASSGIGAEIARELGRRGHNLTIVARRRERLEALAAELTDSAQITVAVRECDLSDASSRAALVDEVLGAATATAGVVNCAGFGTSGRFLDLDLRQEVNQIEVNIAALLHLTHAFAPAMVERGSGAILNVASIAAFQPLPNLATYAATKAFVQSFSEAFHEELRGTGVSCTVLAPGPVETEWATIAGAEAVMSIPGKVSPAGVAKAAIEGMVSGKRSVVPGIVPHAASIGGRYLPRSVLLPTVKRFMGR